MFYFYSFTEAEIWCDMKSKTSREAKKRALTLPIHPLWLKQERDNSINHFLTVCQEAHTQSFNYLIYDN